jgi:mono/diheme cytochrome c family protein
VKWKDPMSAERKHARQAAAERARRAERNRTLSWAIPVVVVAVAAVVAVVLVAAGGSEDGPAEPGSPEELALGQEVFAQNCATCHGEELRGGLAGPPLVHEIYAPDHHPDSSIRAAVARGVQPHHWDFAAMPPIPNLSDADVDAVIAYIRDVQRQEWGGDTP